MPNCKTLSLIKIKNNITSQFFQWEFLELEKKDAKSTKTLLNDLKKSSKFSTKINLVAIEFGSLVDKIWELSAVVQEFGPQNGINNKNFSKSIEKIYFEL